MKPIVLASTSPYRRQLLERLQLPFTQMAPQFEESPLPNESAAARAARFASGKAESVAAILAAEERDAVVIGSDQVVLLGEEILGKPGSHDRAVQQLTRCSGRAVQFITAVAVIDTRSGAREEAVERYEIRYRSLSGTEIDRYLRADTPYDCAGSIRAEGLGVALFQETTGRDPTALIGLPLIALAELLRRRGIDPLSSPHG